MTSETAATGRPVARPAPPPFALYGWLGVWIAAGFIVLGTLVLFLLGIVGDLESIDSSLAEASKAVGGAGGHVKPLPSYIADVNTTLTAIDGALKPVPAATHDISGSLVSMQGNLEKVDGSLKTTSGSLTTTAGALSDTAKALIGELGSLNDTASVLKALSGSLADTSNVLTNVKNVGGQILDVLKHTQSNPDQLGTENIWMRADATLVVRSAAEKDSANIVVGLTDVNKHLKSVCNRIALPPSC